MLPDGAPADSDEFSLENLEGASAEAILPMASSAAYREILHSLGTAVNFRDCMRACALTLHQWTQVDAATIYRLSPNGEELDQIHSVGFSQVITSLSRRISIDGTFTGAAVRQRELISSLNIAEDSRIPDYFRTEMLREGMRSMVAIPLLMHAEVVGAIALGWRRKLALQESDREMLMHIGYGVAIAVEHDLRDAESGSDGLTGLLNRRSFTDALTEKRQICISHGTPLALVMLDLDDFKACNDTHGHNLGDAILKSVADLMRRQLPAEHFLAFRVGGEEFALLLPRIDLAAAKKIVQDMANALSLLDFTGRNGERLKVTFSAGIALYNLASGESAEQFYDRADQAMYSAKRQGKNQIVVISSRTQTR